ncbi:hypothetical protein [Parasitella parasitica]|uniref:PIG-P domain-containing protein n=1 Tax=Parasitella parasitica TaxID=35722 RepID=A0A0B7N4R2_9FUNG|nr:hypothetical protein [Parasitella parasitica]
MVVEQEDLDKKHVPTTLTKRFLEKNAGASLSTSRSTPSLPNLVNYAILSATASLSRRQTAGMSTSMRRGYSEHESIKTVADQPKVNCHRITKRRHSFSTFLNAKYGKSSITDEDDDKFRDYKRLSATVSVNTNPETSRSSLNGVPSKSNQAKKGHRPRSYSDRVPYNLPHVERAPPVAITNKTPAYEYYGFAMYLASFVALGIYLIWAYVPDEILHSLGITYYPNRYWALAIPIWLMTFVWFIFISFMTINLMNTAPLYHIDCITDEHANIMKLDNQLVSDRPSDWIPELHDIPIGLVNKFLYQDDNEDQEDMSLKIIPTMKTTTKKTRHNNTNLNNLNNNTLIKGLTLPSRADTTDEMSEEDALALRRSKYGKRFTK